MVQAIVNFGEHEDRLLSIIKGMYGFRNKSETVNFVIDKFEEELLEPELHPEFVARMKRLEKKGKFISFKSLAALRKELEHA